MNHRRIIALLLVSFTLFLQSCGLIIVNDMTWDSESESDKANASDNNDSERETSEPYVKYDEDGGYSLAMEYLNSLPERDYDGAVFFITTPSSDYISPSDMVTAVSKLAYERNKIVEGKLDIKLITSVEPANTMLANVKNAIASDSYYTDLMMIPIYMTGAFHAQGTLLNMRTIPFFDLDQPFFYSESSNMTSGGFATYAIAGDASISPSSFSAVYMNSDLLGKAGYDKGTIYGWAESGKWTWDKFLATVEAVRDLNQNGTNYYTVTSQNPAQRLPDLIFKSCGHNFVDSARRNIPQIRYRVESVQTVMDTLEKIYNDGNALIDSSENAAGIFSSGQSAFLIDYLYVMSWLTNSGTNWGILPLPVDEEGKSYKTLISNNELIFAIPKHHTNSEYAAITLSALNAASYGYIYDEYVNYNLVNTLRDNESTKMLSMILDTASFDFALAFGNEYSVIADATYKLIRKCATTNNLEGYYQEAVDIANRFMRMDFDLKY